MVWKKDSRETLSSSTKRSDLMCYLSLVKARDLGIMIGKSLSVELAEATLGKRDQSHRSGKGDMISFGSRWDLSDQPLGDARVANDRSVFRQAVDFGNAASVLDDDLLLLASVGTRSEVESWVSTEILPVGAHVVLSTACEEVVDCFIDHCMIDLDSVSVVRDRGRVTKILGV